MYPEPQALVAAPNPPHPSRPAASHTTPHLWKCYTLCRARSPTPVTTFPEATSSFPARCRICPPRPEADPTPPNPGAQSVKPTHKRWKQPLSQGLEA